MSSSSSSPPPAATLSTAEVLRKWGIPYGSNAASVASILRRFEAWCIEQGYPCPGTIQVIDEFLAGMPALAGATQATYRRILLSAHGFPTPMPSTSRRGAPQRAFFMNELPEAVRTLAEREAERLLSGKDILRHHMEKDGALFLTAPDADLALIPQQGERRSESVLQNLAARLEATLDNMRPNTKRAYASEIELFVGWCLMLGRSYWPIEKPTANLYAVWRLAEAEKAGSESLTARLNGIRSALHYPCSRRGLPTPWPPKDPIFATMMGDAKEKSRPPRKARVLSGDEIAALCANLDDLGTLAAIRDKAMILLGRAGALRVSELTTRRAHETTDDPKWDLRIEQLELGEHGLKVRIGKSKTSDACDSSILHVAWGASPGTCPVLATQAWIDTMALQGRTTGPLFPALATRGSRLGGHARLQEKAIIPGSFNKLLQAYARQIGIKEGVSTHSLRRSHVHQALKNKASVVAVQQQGRWKSLDMVAEYAAGLQSESDNSSMYLG